MGALNYAPVYIIDLFRVWKVRLFYVCCSAYILGNCEEIRVCDIVKETGLSKSKISYQIKILKYSGLISDRQEDRLVY